MISGMPRPGTGARGSSRIRRWRSSTCTWGSLSAVRRAVISARVIGWSRMMMASTSQTVSGQVERFEHLVATLEVPEQALDEAARGGRGDQLQAIAVEHDLLVPRRRGHE